LKGEPAAGVTNYTWAPAEGSLVGKGGRNQPKGGGGARKGDGDGGKRNQEPQGRGKITGKGEEDLSREKRPQNAAIGASWG